MYRFALLVVAVTLLSGSMAQAASYKKTDGAIVDPIMHTSGSTHPYSGNNLEPNANLTDANLTGADLTYANLSSADLKGADLDDATFSTGTTLYDGQTVLQHGYHDDPAGLQVYLKASPVSASSASNLTIVPEPASVLLLLTGLLTLARIRF